jgi:uncharacterized membrane protein
MLLKKEGGKESEDVYILVDFIFSILLLIHVASVALWLGAAFFSITVVLPALSETPPTIRAEFLTKLVPKFVRFVGASSGVGIAAGVILFGYLSSTGNTPTGLGFDFLLVGAVVGFVAFVIAVGVVLPSSVKLANLIQVESKNSDSSSDKSDLRLSKIANIQNAIRSSAKAVAILLAIAVSLMVLAITV